MGVDRDQIQKTILALLEISALLAVAAIAPNTLQLLKYVGPKDKRWQKLNYVKRATDKLVDRGLIEFKKNSKGISCARITKRGRAELERYRLHDLTIPHPKRWDQKYRLVIFDIKEWKRGTRDRVRRWLEHLGFIKLQNSVWVYPYECQEVVQLLKSYFKIGKEILYLTVDNIENDRWLRQEFKLN